MTQSTAFVLSFVPMLLSAAIPNDYMASWFWVAGWIGLAALAATFRET